ncbi:hypothetical protein PIB30_110666, partial [Stylosanthes scabra]|nr:hypothetical protein [Stylosanthes scabra]
MDIIIEKMSSERGGSRIPRATRSSSPTDSTVSSATSRPKRHRDLLVLRVLFVSLAEHIPDVSGPTVPRMSSISTPEGPAK